MGLRRDFLNHQRKTVDSFSFVKADILNINSSIGAIKSLLAALESKISAIEADGSFMKAQLDKFSQQIKSQNADNLAVSTRIGNADKSIKNLSLAIASQNKPIKKEIKKLSGAIGRRLKTIEKKETGLEKTIKSQRSRIVQLNRKIDGKKVIRKTIRGKNNTLQKKKITTVKMPKKKITTIKTPKRTITKTETPKRETIVEIIRQGKKPLI